MLLLELSKAIAYLDYSKSKEYHLKVTFLLCLGSFLLIYLAIPPHILANKSPLPLSCISVLPAQKLNNVTKKSSTFHHTKAKKST